MTSCMVARVGAHADVAGLAQHSSVPVINALSNDFHPLQTIADFLTIHETFPGAKGGVAGAGVAGGETRSSGIAKTMGERMRGGASEI